MTMDEHRGYLQILDKFCFLFCELPISCLITTFFFTILCLDNGVLNKSIGLNLTQTTQLVLPSTDNEITSPKLSEPRHLFSLQRELGPQQAPRWPAECQVSIFHLKMNS